MFHGTLTAVNSNIAAQFMMDDVELLSIFPDSESGDFTQASHTFFIECSEGSEVYLLSLGPTIFVSNLFGYTSFSGQLIGTY